MHFILLLYKMDLGTPSWKLGHGVCFMLACMHAQSLIKITTITIVIIIIIIILIIILIIIIIMIIIIIIIRSV